MSERRSRIAGPKQVNQRNFSHFYDYKISYFKEQNYAKLKSECRRLGKLFVDPLFEPVSQNVYSSKPMPRGIEWMRPCEINPDARFVVNTANASDLDQGTLGNCWFIAACMSLTYARDLFEKVVPAYQDCSGEGYCGIFHFRFWIYGSWHDVVVDDYLPVWSNTKKLVFCSNKEEPNEFWAALLEKAYAKVCGGYESLEHGYTSDALIDMCGGLEENFLLNKNDSTKVKDNLWNILCKSRQLKSMNAACIDPDPHATYSEIKLPNGLIKGHAYSISRTAVVYYRNRNVKLIRLRNPWGRREWNGSWADSSPEWNSVPDRVKEELEYKKLNEATIHLYKKGEFWMSFEDFYSNFDSIQFCHLTPESFSDELQQPTHMYGKIEWNLIIMHGEWVAGRTAGGSGNNGDERYWNNPQYLVKLVEVDFDDNENMSTIIVALMQKNTREKRKQRNASLSEEFIQFRLYHVRNEADAERAAERSVKLTESQTRRVDNSGSYVNKREVTKRFRVEPGYYLIVPSTFDYNAAGQFTLRFFTETSSHSSDLNVNNRVYELKNEPVVEEEGDFGKVKFRGNVQSSLDEQRVNSFDNIVKEEVNISKQKDVKRIFG